MVKLDQRHHTLIQALMTRGPLSEADVKSMFQDLCSEGASDGGFHQFIAAINKEMDFVQMELRASRNQYDGVVYYGVVNKLGNEQAKMGTRYSHAQIAFFKAVLEAIISDSSSQGKISNIQALNLRLDYQNEQQAPEVLTPTSAGSLHLTLAQKEKTLTELTHEKWLSQTEDGMVALGIRAFLELWSVFKNFDIPFCDVCNEAGIKAQSCPNTDCPVRIHDYCLKIKFHRQQAGRVCPSCGTSWDCEGLDASMKEEELSSIDIPRISPELRRPRSRLRASGRLSSTVSLA